MAIGRVTLEQAKRQAREANEYVVSQKPSLLERLTGAGNTVGDLLDQMPAAKAKNTAKSWRSLDRKIRGALGSVQCASLTVKHCAGLIEAEIDAGKARSSQALRSRLDAVCKRGMQLGWLEFNPAEPTQSVEVKTKRARLTLEQFQEIYAKAPEVAAWLPSAMLLALTTGQDRSTLSGLRWPAVGPEFVSLQRGKTGVHIEIPLALRLEALGVSVQDALDACRSTVRSLKLDYVIHHRQEYGNAPLGSKVHPDRMSHAFAEARALAGIAGENPPTWHEIRSLAKRLYGKQGGVDTKALLGHKTERMSDLYANPRGVEAIRVSYAPVDKSKVTHSGTTQGH